MAPSFARRAAATAAATALLVGAGAGAAAAATHNHSVDNAASTVTVRFVQKDWTDVTICGGAITSMTDAPGVAADLVVGDLKTKLETLTSDPRLTVLKTGLGVPFATVAGVATIPALATVSAKVAPNNYALVTYCAGEKSPTITPITVGNPFDAALGSVQGLSSGGGSSAGKTDAATARVVTPN